LRGKARRTSWLPRGAICQMADGPPCIAQGLGVFLNISEPARQPTEAGWPSLLQQSSKRIAALNFGRLRERKIMERNGGVFKTPEAYAKTTSVIDPSCKCGGNVSGTSDAGPSGCPVSVGPVRWFAHADGQMGEQQGPPSRHGAEGVGAPVKNSSASPPRRKTRSYRPISPSLSSSLSLSPLPLSLFLSWRKTRSNRPISPPHTHYMCARVCVCVCTYIPSFFPPLPPLLSQLSCLVSRSTV
jgi:hypothetical protein